MITQMSVPVVGNKSTNSYECAAMPGPSDLLITCLSWICLSPKLLPARTWCPQVPLLLRQQKSHNRTGAALDVKQHVSLRAHKKGTEPGGRAGPCSTEQPLRPATLITQVTGQKVNIPWQKDGVVEEVLKLLEKRTVVLLPVLHFRCLWAGAALAITCTSQVRFGGLGALLHVHKPRGWHPDWDLDFCFKREQQRLRMCIVLLHQCSCSEHRTFTFTSCKGLLSYLRNSLASLLEVQMQAG